MLSCMLSTGLFAQQKDSLGLYNIPLLNHQESQFFKEIFEDEELSFDFSQRRLAFHDEDGSIKDKQSFFDRVKAQNISKMTYGIIILDENEQRNLGRFDAIIIIGIPQDKTIEMREEILKKLQSKKACSLC